MSPNAMRTPQVRYFVRLAAVFALYVATGEFGLHFYAVHGFATLIWPPTGIALAAFVLWGYGMSGAVALGAFVVNVATGATAPEAFGIALGNTLEAAIGLYLLRNAVVFDPFFRRLRDGVGFVLVAFLTTTVSAAIGVSTLYISGIVPARGIIETATAWWIGDLISALSISPLLIYWGARPFFTRTRRQWIEGSISFGASFILITLLFWTPYGSIGPISLLYLLVFALIWTSVTVGPRGTTLALFVISTYGILGLLFGYGPATARLSSQYLFSTQIIIGTIDVIFLIFMTLIEERAEALRVLREHLGQTRSALEKSQLSDRAKTEFISILAHEMRNPLAAVLAGLEVLEHGSLAPEDRGFANSMKSNIQMMARVLDDLLDTARISRKGFVLAKEPAELQTVVRSALVTAEPGMANRRHAASVTLPEEPIIVMADPVRLAQIFINLLTNASKFTAPGGRIRVSCRVEDGQAVVRVEDSGIGLDPESLSTVFDGNHARHSIQRRSGGLGIGLSLAKRLTELHGGTIEAASAGLGHGSTFAVRLPITRSTPPKLDRAPRRERRETSGRGPSGAGTRRVLVVDDNAMAARGLATLLEKDGYAVETAANGFEGLARARRFAPEVILLDIGLPGMDGYAVARVLTQEGSPALLVAVTGYGLAEDRHKAFESGFAHFLVKPVSIADIKALLENHALAKRA